MSAQALTCPRCGQHNQCAQANAQTPVAHCWCFTARIEPGVLDSLPAELRNRACLCPSCAQALPPAETEPTAR